MLLFSDPDYDKKLPDPLEELFFYFVRETESNNPQEALPTREEMQAIELIANKPPSMEMKPNEKLLFFRYRYALSTNKKFLVNFLHSVQWTNQREEQEAIVLLRKWAKIDRDDALHLLSVAFCANSLYKKSSQRPPASMKIVREYASTIVCESSNRELSEIMLQLVQALRYDDDDSALATMLTDRAVKSLDVACLFFWYLKAETEPSNTR